MVQRGLFTPSTPEYLGFCRLVMFGWLFLWYLTADFSFIGQYPAVMWDAVPILKIFGLSAQPSATTVTLLKTVWLLSLLLSCIGLFTRTAIGVAFFLGIYLLAATHSFNKVNHSDAALLLAMFVLMLSRCGDAFSVDRLIRVSRKGDLPTPLSGEYNWPVQMVRLVWVIIFFLAGIAKLRRSGSAWMFSDNMANLIQRQQVVWNPPTTLGTFFLEYPWTCKAMATGAVMLEIASPLVLFSKVARLLIVPGMLVMQIGIRLIMGDDFSQFMTIYIFFIPWLLVGALSLRLVPARQIEVLYDGKCGLCGRTVAVLRRVDLLRRLRFRDVTTDWQAIQADHPQINQASALMDMHVVDCDGRVATGFAGYRRIAWAVPLGWLFLPLLYLPGVSVMGEKVYRRVADQRLAGGQCSI